MILTSPTNQPHYDAVIFSSNSGKDLTIANSLMTLITDNIKIGDDHGTNHDVKICVFHDNFHNKTNVNMSRINLALDSSSLYFIILTEDFISERLNTEYCCCNAIMDTLENETKRIIPVFYRNDETIKTFINEIKYFRLLVPLHLEDIFENRVVNEFTKPKWKQTFEPVVQARLTKERTADDCSLYTINETGCNERSIEYSFSSFSLEEDETCEQTSSANNHSNSRSSSLQVTDSVNSAARERMESVAGNDHSVTDIVNNKNTGDVSTVNRPTTSVPVNNTRNHTDTVAKSDSSNSTKQDRLGIVAQIVSVRGESSNLNVDETQVKELEEN
ncbi:hypothetical protein HELRODRAFT_192689 [Helobdella robusta]|uniref:Uncharacterized protein n=1 Tax=Helobdella robusta TaxID=6412 RepID=T1FU71_HELRO|nr:hypothetical protein HELRODRAFT_192689 [Helobdella robusta]ESO00001.1 hypothetical protein HELRODRAFT_192689 [Helobdella robusta]